VPASDFYSLGCLAHELLTGRPPHVSDSPFELIALHARGTPDLSTLPNGLRQWTARLLGPTPADRFAALAELLSALAEAEAEPAPRKREAARPMMAADVPSVALLPPESLADAAGRQSIMPFTMADGGPVSLDPNVTIPPEWHAREEARPDLSPPGYEILGELGRGGMGVVYQARQTSLGRVVALKMILGGGHASDQRRLRFRREAELMARLQHPNILAIYDIGEFQGNAYLAMELCPGGNLWGRLHDGPLPPEEAARLVAKMARALAAAHAAGVVHRDVKPGNVLFTPDGEPKLTDFGLARLLEEEPQEKERLTAPGLMMGTPRYMPPEQIEGRAVTASDIYALGAVLYECLTGSPPFSGGSMLDLLTRAMTERPAPPSHVRPGVPAALDPICLRCLEKDPASRYPPAAAVAEALESFLRGDQAEPAPRRKWWWPFG
jgi:serine/threonine protein kinase